MKTIRAFIAIHLPDEVKTTLQELSQQLASRMPSRAVGWVKPERMHLTLRFLGDTDSSRLPDIKHGLDRVVADHSSFMLKLDRLGCFPNVRRPRVIWVGLQGDMERLQAIKREIDELLSPLGWPLESRPFRAHLTLGRVKDSRQLGGETWSDAVRAAAVPVTAIHLVESQLRPSGPIYTVLHSSVLS